MADTACVALPTAEQRRPSSPLVDALAGGVLSGVPQAAVEAKPAPALSTAEPSVPDLFLSPRVIDRKTYEEFGQALRDLARGAAAQREALESALQLARSLDDKASVAARALSAKLEQATKIVPLVDQRLARLEQLLASPPELLADQRLKALERARAEIDRHLSAIVQEQAAIQAQRFKDELARAIEEQVEGAVRAALGQSIEDASTLAHKLEALVSDGEARLTQLIDTAQSQAEHARKSEETHAAAYEERLQAALAKAESELALKTAGADAAARVLDSRLATAGSTLAQLKNIDLKPIEDALRSLEDQRSKLADFETVARTLEQGDAMAERARFASKQYESVVQQADQARRHFGESLLKGASAIDALEHRLASITDTLDKASSQADAIHARSPAEAQARALADHLREMGQWLAGIIAQANESGTNLSAALDRLPTARRLGA
jgi:hypothetical protein